MPAKWRSFGRSSGIASPVTLGTLVHYAQAAGWQMPVTFDASGMFDLEYPEPEATDPIVVGTKQVFSLPFDISGIDLTRPPGLVGVLAQWIESQSRRPREHLAVAAALQAMGNILGLRYTCPRGETTTNLFSFCVAGSRTGKEAIQQSIQRVHEICGYGRCQHGSIKSEQEVIRNVIDHQAALYVIDEFGLFLAKVQNAQKRGGASYLDGVIGVLMSAYGKANGKLLLTGDMRRELMDRYKAKVAKVQRDIDDNGSTRENTRALEAATASLERLDGGLERPFLSLIGFTTPITFDGMIDEYMATNGFIGRSLIFREHETAPRRKRDFQPGPIPDALHMRLIAVATGGEADAAFLERIEHYGNRVRIMATADAQAMLDQAADWLEDLSDDLKGRNGLESLSLGAYELIVKVALILGAPAGVVTTEDVRWAFALIRADIATKVRLVAVTTAQADGDRASEIAAKVKVALSGGDWMTFSVLERRTSRKPALRPALVDVLDKMASAGKLEIRQKTNPRTGKEFAEYRLKG